MTLDYIPERSILLCEHKDLATISSLWECKMHFRLQSLHNGMFAQMDLPCRQPHT